MEHPLVGKKLFSPKSLGQMHSPSPSPSPPSLRTLRLQGLLGLALPLVQRVDEPIHHAVVQIIPHDEVPDVRLQELLAKRLGEAFPMFGGALGRVLVWEKLVQQNQEHGHEKQATPTPWKLATNLEFTAFVKERPA